MRTFTRRQKILLGALVGLLAVLIAVMVVQVASPRTVEQERPKTLQTIPDAEDAPAPDSKKEAYRGAQSALDAYWESLGDDTDPSDSSDYDADPMDDMRTQRAKALTYEDITSGTEEPKGRMESVPAGRTIRDDPQRQAILRAIAEQEERQRRAEEEKNGTAGDEEEPEPDRMTGLQSQIKRTGAISSLDEDIPEELGTGFSSLDDSRFIAADATRPYRCMFARSEKVRSGQRVSVRLLEDVVVDGTLVPRNTRLSAVCTIGKRMEVAISTIEVNGRIHTVSFDGYDTDGTRGIYCSDLVETRKQAKSQGISSAGSILGGRSMVGIARDAANLGLAIAQSASGETTVSIPEGYVFYLVQKTD